MEGTSETHQKTSPQTTSESTVKRTPVPRYYKVGKTGREVGVTGREVGVTGREVGVIIGIDQWSSDRDEEFREQLLFHKDLVETVLKMNREEMNYEENKILTDETNTILRRLGILGDSPKNYELVSVYSFERLKVEFVPEGSVFCIDVHELGEETIVYLDSLKKHFLQEF